MIWKKQIISLLVLAPAVVAGDFKSANALYDAGKFIEAATAYDKIEPKTAAVYFNLGNSHFRMDELGRAVLDFERARQLAPSDPDILANLRFAEERLGVADINVSPRTVTRFWESLTSGRTIDQWARHEVAGVWLTVLLAAGAVWWPRWRSGLVIVSGVTALGLVIGITAITDRMISERTGPTAIVLAKRVEARFAPLTDATVHFQVGEGTQVLIREDRGQWWLVERADAQQGWIRADAAERVLPNHTSMR